MTPDRLIGMITGVVQTAMLGLVAKARVADILADGPLDAGQIAARTGFTADGMHRLLRALAALGVFQVDGQARFANNEASNALRSDAELLRLRAMAEYFGSAWNLRSWAALEHAMRSGDIAFDHVHQMSAWDWFAANDGDARCFAEQMSDVTAVAAPMIASHHVFSGLSCLCDIAGGRGAMLASILEAHTNLRGILFDTGQTFEEAKRVFARRRVTDRVETVSGSFFESVPSAEGYLLKDILHDWDDERSRAILTQIRHAARPHARLIIVEAVLEPGETGIPKATSDMQMMVAHGGRQRSRAQFRALFESCGFQLERVEPLRGSMFGIVVGTAM